MREVGAMDRKVWDLWGRTTFFGVASFFGVATALAPMDRDEAGKMGQLAKTTKATCPCEGILDFILQVGFWKQGVVEILPGF